MTLKITALAIVLQTLEVGQVTKGEDGWPPRPQGHVADLAGLLDTESASRLEGRAIRLSKRSTVEGFVVTTNDTGPSGVAGWTEGLMRVWGLGQAHRKNSFALTLAMDVRRLYLKYDGDYQNFLTQSEIEEVPDRSGRAMNEACRRKAEALGVAMAEKVSPLLKKKQYGKGMSLAWKLVEKALPKPPRRTRATETGV